MKRDEIHHREVSRTRITTPYPSDDAVSSEMKISKRRVRKLRTLLQAMARRVLIQRGA
jgi:hypothetical protein